MRTSLPGVSGWVAAQAWLALEQPIARAGPLLRKCETQRNISRPNASGSTAFAARWDSSEIGEGATERPVGLNPRRRPTRSSGARYARSLTGSRQFAFITVPPTRCSCSRTGQIDAGDQCRARMKMEVIVHFELRYAVRQLLRSPWFTVVAILGLGLGIGANVALFSVINSVFLRPLPYRQPGQLVRLSSTHEAQNLRRVGFSYPRFLEVQQRQQVFSDLAFSVGNALALT